MYSSVWQCALCWHALGAVGGSRDGEALVEVAVKQAHHVAAEHDAEALRARRAAAVRHDVPQRLVERRVHHSRRVHVLSPQRTQLCARTRMFTVQYMYMYSVKYFKGFASRHAFSMNATRHCLPWTVF